MRAFQVFLTAIAACLVTLAAHAQSPGPLRIEITQGVIEPLPVAVPDFVAESAEAAQFAKDIAEVVRNDLVNSGLFRAISQDAFISQITAFNSPVQFSDWKAINAHKDAFNINLYFIDNKKVFDDL